MPAPIKGCRATSLCRERTRSFEWHDDNFAPLPLVWSCQPVLYFRPASRNDIPLEFSPRPCRLGISFVNSRPPSGSVANDSGSWNVCDAKVRELTKVNMFGEQGHTVYRMDQARESSCDLFLGPKMEVPRLPRIHESSTVNRDYCIVNRQLFKKPTSGPASAVVYA